jgi:hypothetical protein
VISSLPRLWPFILNQQVQYLTETSKRCQLSQKYQVNTVPTRICKFNMITLPTRQMSMSELRGKNGQLPELRGKNGQLPELRGKNGQLPELVGEAEDAVDMLEEVQAAGHLRLDLVGPAEDVRVVLLEPPHPGQPGQRT